MIRAFVLIVLVGYSFNSYSLDLDGMKKQLRGLSKKMLGEKITTKYFGPGESSIKLGPIPNIVENSKSTYTLDANSVLAKQGGEFEKLTNEQKRPYRISFLEELFESTRKQKVEDTEIIKWLNTMEQGSSREGVYRALVLDQVYRQLESFQDAPPIDAVDFTRNFYVKFINRDVSADNLRKLNIYSIKRVVVEKCLDIMEAYEGDPDGLYRWYAVMSEELANKFIFNNKLRDNKNAKIHYEWAKSVPYQHIKSEMIVKLHYAFNKWLK